ncbi:magnesium transporter [Lactococcus piscium]|uniref:Magnesium transporter MgtE n=1 Tax=Pseudolactococcus carnosus TaxID=2749961 RepID=A0ABT0ASA8_9LACT|nr:magnesium transporter [Lactococcus carnosus]MCJ1989538.1 magnesium transporter [Lactococcus carnosus]MCJ1991177.1 magnesium transporter [Lactococcus carnosus]SCA91370.1 Magnesium transporter MgtE [Lactococcus piscium]
MTDNSPDPQNVFLALQELLEDNEIQAFREGFLDHHIYDQSQFYLDFTETERLELYSILSPQELSEIFENLDFDAVDIKPYLKEISPEYLSAMFDEMSTDNAADILTNLSKRERRSIFTLMAPENVSEIRNLMHYDEETAGSLMTTEFVAVVANQTVSSAMTVIKATAEDAETIYYVYVLDSGKQLLGVISLRSLLISHDDTLISDIVNEHIIKVNVDEPQERVARYFRDYDLLALPVISHDNLMLGIVTVDDIIDVIDEEAQSDYSGLAGVNTDNVNQNPIQSAAKRLPWLVALLFLGMGTASLIDHFDGLVSRASVLAIFISLITGTAGNAGTQSLAVSVRRISLNDDENKSFFDLILTEITTGLVTGAVTGLTIFVVVSLWKGNIMLGLAVGVAMFCAITVANLAGSLIPVGMDRLGFDPAVASGPFISTMSDLTSVFIYFSIAEVFISFI